MTLYRELAKGQALEATQLGRALGVSPAEARALMARDRSGASSMPMARGVFSASVALRRRRSIIAGGRRPHPLDLVRLGQPVYSRDPWASRRVYTTPDPENGEVVRLFVSPDRIESAEPEDAVVSFLLPNAQDLPTTAASVMVKFCHFVFFFTSRSSGERWMAKHPGTFLFSLDEAFVLAKRLNARNSGPELARRALFAPAAQHSVGCCPH